MVVDKKGLVGNSETSTDLFAGTMPEPIKKRALQSALAIVGGGANYLSAWLRRPTQAVNDITDARALVTQILAEEVANKIKADPDAIAAAVEKLAPSFVRREVSKVRVAKSAFEEISRQDREEPIQNVSAGDIDEDWLNSFERFAEDATTDRMQGLWARVLAGEIINPGSFSKRTLRFVHELDLETAALFESVRDFVIDGKLILPPDQRNQMFGTLLRLQDAGVIVDATNISRWSMTHKKDVGCGLVGRNYALMLFGDDEQIFTIDNYPLTRVGIELTQIVPNRDEITVLKMAGMAMKDKGGQAAAIGKIHSRNGTLFDVAKDSTEIIWGDAAILNI